MFRPCIDLHEGKVKQIVGGTLGMSGGNLKTNFVSAQPSEWYADLYRKDGLTGGHVIMLGPHNERAALNALRAYPGGLQIGGGIKDSNAKLYLDAGASHVIITSWIFNEGALDWDRLKAMTNLVGRERLVLDLSCKKRDGDYVVMTNHWQYYTDLKLSRDLFNELSEWCDEFLVHSVDVEGLRQGINWELVESLADWVTVPTTYAGGANSLADLERITQLTKNRIDLTIGSALDIFGGNSVRYEEAVAFNRTVAQ